VKQLVCDCGQAVFFESDSCVACGRELAFDPVTLTMRTLTPTDQGYSDASGHRRQYCKNHEYPRVCNWLQVQNSANEYCLGCDFNRTIPNLSKAENLQRWAHLEAAKKRVLFTLLTLGLSIPNGHAQPGGLLFDFLEDSQSDRERYPDLRVTTGHLNGVITLNVLEADNAAREAQREALNEHYRSLLGHMRHEFGHFFHDAMLRSVATPGSETLNELRQLFGDERADYQTALTRYYQQGPAAGTELDHITAYASSHPLEDWAETWGHYLHIFDVIETAVARGVLSTADNFQARLRAFRKFSVTLNELNRSMGLPDAYPFVLTPTVEAKLAFVDATVSRLRAEYAVAVDC